MLHYFMHFGLILVIIGGIFLLKNLGFAMGIDWGLVWPALFILLGVKMMVMQKHGGWRGKWHDKYCNCGGGGKCRCGGWCGGKHKDHDKREEKATFASHEEATKEEKSE